MKNQNSILLTVAMMFSTSLPVAGVAFGADARGVSGFTPRSFQTLEEEQLSLATFAAEMKRQRAEQATSSQPPRCETNGTQDKTSGILTCNILCYCGYQVVLNTKEKYALGIYSGDCQTHARDSIRTKWLPWTQEQCLKQIESGQVYR